MENTTLLDTLKQQSAAKQILNCLEDPDICRLAMTNKAFHKRLQGKYTRQITTFNEFVDLKTSKTKKPTNKGSDEGVTVIKEQKCVIVKTSIFSCPPEIFQTTKNWKYVTAIPYNVESMNEKLKSGTYNFFAHNTTPTDLFFMNRTLIDPSLEFEKAGFETEVEADNEDLYKQLYEGTALTENFDFTNPESLRQRQKQLLEAMNAHKQKKEETAKYCQEIGVETLKTFKRISIILCFGGYFSMGVFEKNKCILHKSDHKYVCRKKAGGRQLNKDKCSGSNIQSMGSEIRRHQEKLHQEKVSSILSENFAELQKSDVILLQAPGINKLILVNANESLYKLRHKLRSICLTAKKANYTEVERIYEAVTKIYLVKSVQQ